MGLVLLLNAMAASPALHKLIHKDADKASHECAVTMFAHGKVDAATVDVLCPTPSLSIGTETRIYFSFVSTAIKNLPPNRAPPLVSSPQV